MFISDVHANFSEAREMRPYLTSRPKLDPRVANKILKTFFYQKFKFVLHNSSKLIKKIKVLF